MSSIKTFKTTTTHESNNLHCRLWRNRYVQWIAHCIAYRRKQQLCLHFFLILDSKCRKTRCSLSPLVRNCVGHIAPVPRFGCQSKSLTKESVKFKGRLGKLMTRSLSACVNVVVHKQSMRVIHPLSLRWRSNYWWKWIQWNREWLAASLYQWPQHRSIVVDFANITIRMIKTQWLSSSTEESWLDDCEVF